MCKNTQNAKFPPFTEREAHPDDYYDNANTFDMSKINENDRTNMDKVKNFLTEYKIYFLK